VSLLQPGLLSSEVASVEASPSASRLVTTEVLVVVVVLLMLLLLMVVVVVVLPPLSVAGLPASGRRVKKSLLEAEAVAGFDFPGLDPG